MAQDFKVNTELKMNQEVYVTNQSIIKITEDVVFMNRYKSSTWGAIFYL